MFRPMASMVSALSGLVANGHQVVRSVSSSPSKIPYGGFSPVRLQIGIRPRPSPQAHTRRRLVRGHKSVGPSPTFSPFRGNRRTQSALEKRPAGRFRSRGPWLARGLYCPAGSSLTMASSEALASSRRLMISAPGLCRAEALPSLRRAARDSPIYSACPSLRAVSRTPADRVAMTVVLPPAAAFTHPCGVRHPRCPRKNRFTRGRVTRQQSSLDAAARSFVGPSPTRTFTFELSFHESPHLNVEYNYAANQSIAATGLSPAGHAALWAATRIHPWGFRLLNPKSSIIPPPQ